MVPFIVILGFWPGLIPVPSCDLEVEETFSSSGDLKQP